MGSATVVIANFTPVPLSLADSRKDWGDWGEPPPALIAAGGRDSFRGETDNAGTSGYVAYETGVSLDPAVGVVRERRRLLIEWSRPYWGDNECTVTIPKWHGGGTADAPFTVDVRQTMKDPDPTWVVNLVMNPDYSAATALQGASTPSSFHGPTCVSWGPDRLDLFDASPDTSLLHRWYTDATSWSSWETIVQPAPRALGEDRVSRWWATSWGPGRLDVFGLGKNGHVEHVWYQEGADGPGWGQWDDLGGDGLTGYLAAASSGPGRLHVVGVDTAGALHHLTFARGAWGPWVTIGGPRGLPANPLMLAAASPGVGLIDLFSVDLTGATWRARFTEGAGWGSWMDLSIASFTPLTPGTLAAAFDGERMRLFAMTLGGNLMQTKESQIILAGHPAAFEDWTYFTSVDHGASACTRGSRVHIFANSGGQYVNTTVERSGPLFDEVENVTTEVLGP